MSDNIPIDILDAANSAYMMQLEMGEEAVTAGEHKNMMVIEIAKAIYAERLRCAEIVGNWLTADAAFNSCLTEIEKQILLVGK